MLGQESTEILQCKIGLVNHAGKYLTAETFGFKVNASGASFRKKQLWSLEQEEAGVVYLKSHLGRYLTTDKQGVLSCDSEDRCEGGQFELVYHKDGRWAFQSKLNKCFFSATEDNVRCGEMVATDVEHWHIRLDLHPQLNLYNVNRKRFAHLHEGNGKLQCDEVIPWGADALITLEYIKGKYAFKSSDNRYLTKDGSLVKTDKPGENVNALFTLEIHSEGMAFKDNDGKYLTAVAKEATLQTKNTKVSKDEMFILRDSHPQVCLTAKNGKKISSKQGVDLSAKQDEVTDCEIFQLEFHKKSSQWRFRSSSDILWSVAPSGGVQVNKTSESPDSLFAIEWYENGQVALKSTNGKYVTARPNGSLYATADSVSENEKYHMTIVNRPTLVLRCDHGFVGFKCPNNPRIECNKANHDTITLEHDNGKNGEYYLTGHNGKYWDLNTESMLDAVSEEPKAFRLQFEGQSRFAIKAPNGCFIKAEQNGIMCAKVIDVTEATLWEY